ncbi:flagellar hook-length control protein FliK [Persephonella sp.]
MINIKPFINNYEFFQIVKPLGKSIHLRAGETVKAEVIDILPTGGVVLRMKGGVMTVETDIPLQKDTSLLLKILNTPTTDHRLKIQIIGVLDKNNTLQVLNFQQTQLRDILSLLESSPQLKESILNFLFQTGLENISRMSQKEASLLANLLSAGLKTVKPPVQELEVARQLFPNIQNLQPEKMKELIAATGIFFENKLKKKDLKGLERDLKGLLLREENLSPEEKQMLKTVENYQLLSRLTGGIFTFVPVLWQELDRGDLFFKKSSRGKNVYFCRIDLDFKNLGKVTAGVFQFGKELYVNLFVEDETLKQLIEEDADTLRERLKGYGFSDVSIKFLKQLPEDRKFIDEDFLRLKA